MKEKGIEDAIDVVTKINGQMGYAAFALDIYGQVDPSYQARFDALRQRFPAEVRYCGCVAATESVGVIKDYFALLFPTYYEGEGFAGTLIDAFSAGVPVIATDWRYNAEIVHSGVGFLYQTHHLDQLEAILTTLRHNPAQAQNKKQQCLAEAAKYSAANTIKQISQLLGEE